MQARGTRLIKVAYDPFRLGKIEKAIPTTEAQKEMWATLVLDKESTLCYNEVLELTFEGKVDFEALERAFQQLLKRHVSLRSSFSTDGRFFYINEYKFQQIKRIKSNNSELEKFKTSEVQNAFNLEDGPCIRLSLIEVSPMKSVLFFSAHHLICDGWSLSILLTELSLLYSGKTLTESHDFVDYALSLKTNETDKKYWLKEFSEPFNGNKLPTDFQRPKYRTYSSQRYDYEFPTSLVKDIKKFAAKNRTSYFTVLMSAFQILVQKLSGTADIVVGMATAAQSQPGNENLVGHLVNMLPLRSKIDLNTSYDTYLKELRTKMLDAIDHQNFSFGSLLKEIRIERNSSEIPLVNIVFNIDQQAEDQGLSFSDLKASYTSVPRLFENFELFVNAVSCGNNLTVECQYNTSLYKLETISNWLKNYELILKELILHPDLNLVEMRLLELYVPMKLAAAIEVNDEGERDEATETIIINIWEKVLKTKNIGVFDNFFTLGGHSLLIIEMISVVEKELSVEISARNVFENPTVTGLSRYLVKQGSSVSSHKDIPLADTAFSYPLTHSQMQVWYLEEIYPDTTMHNLPSSIRLKFKVNRRLLEETLQIIISRHDILQTKIIVQEGIPVQVVGMSDDQIRSFKLPFEKITVNEVDEKLSLEAMRVISKESPLMFTTKLLQISNDDFVFFFMPHHAIWDGWSFDIFFSELDAVYSSLENKTELNLSPVEITYKDYSSWLRKRVESEDLGKEINYWKNRLGGSLPILELPLDFKRPPAINPEGLTLPFNLSTEQIDKIRTYARKEGSSVFNVFLTAFKITLSKFSNIDDIIVGAPVRGRKNPKLLNTIGYFVNAVALRTKINLNERFEDNLKRVEKSAFEAFDNEEVPFQVVLNEINTTKDNSRSPVFQTFFSYQDVSNRRPEINGHPYVQVNVSKASTHTDLDLWIKSSDSKIEGAFEFRKDLFKPKSIERFKEAFLFLIDSLDNNTVKTLDTNQISEILDASQNYSGEEVFYSVHKSFEEKAKSQPNAIAIENSTDKLTFSQLDSLANIVANGLIRSGVKSGDLVGISLNRDLNLIVGLLGILKSGAGYVPLDPAFPQERLDYMIESSNPAVILTERSLTTRFNNNVAKLLIQDLLESSVRSDLNPCVPQNLSNTVYVIYTSGSTGRPKGVQISHRALANFISSMSREPGFTSHDKILAVTTLSFDIAALEIFLPLTVGGSFFLASSYDVIDGRALKSIISENAITMMQATPSTWRLLLSAGWSGAHSFKVLCGGEPFPLDLSSKLLNIVSEVWNMYGPTETTVWSTIKRLSHDQETITVGKPIANTSVYILDPFLNLCPFGVAGELYIGGLGLADGYYGRPDLTAERFINNPFVPGEKFYATGDMARLRDDGDLECLGRQDGQIKIRGYRIELGEIEAALSRIKGIESNAVITKEVSPGDVRILAFIVGENQDVPNEVKLRELLGHELPKYMVPSHFIRLDAIPQTLNGKIDKKTLGTMFNNTPKKNEIVKLPKASKNTFKEELRSIWLNVLKTQSIKDTDDFFHIGGNSLLAVELSGKISKQFSFNMPLRMLLENSEFDKFVKSLSTKILTPIESDPKLELFSIVPIKSSGNKNPIFCFHGVGGNVLNYIKLIPAIDIDRPLMGVQSIGLKHGSKIDSVEKMAKAYIEELKIIQPFGPYYLAGGSMGGMLALEVAIQLNASGDKIEKLVMFDTFGPSLDLSKYKAESLSFVKRIKSSIEYKKKYLLFKLKKKLLKFLKADLPLEMKLFDIENNNYKALWKYRPKQYPGDLDLIRSNNDSEWYSDPYMGWSETISGEIRTFPILGDHNHFIESPELITVLSKLT